LAPIIVGHRANSGRIIYWYKRMGVKYVEVDVNVVGGRLVVKHGPPATRRATPLGQLAQWIDYKLFYRDPLLRAQPLATWLRLVHEKLDLEGVLLDLKAPVDPHELARQIHDSRFPGRILVSANDHRLLPRIAEALPQAETIASFNVRPVDVAACAAQAKPRGVGLRVDLLDPETVADLKNRGYIVSTWTVNSPEQARAAAAAGVDLIITDRPDIVKKALGG